jgi:hypothetical protein
MIAIPIANRKLGRVADIGSNLEKTVKWSKFAPPSLIKATPSESTSDSNIVSNQQIASDEDIAHPATLSEPAILCDSARISNFATLSNPAISCNSATLSNPVTPSDPAIFSNPLTFSDADDVMLTSPSQSKELHFNHGTPFASDPSEGSTTAVVAVMRGNPKDGYTCQSSNKHCKQKIVQVLLDSGSNGNLIFVTKTNPCCFPIQKAGSTVVEYFKWDLPDTA